MTAGRQNNSHNTDWCTPLKYVNAISDMFEGHIALDPCSNDLSIVPALRRMQPPENGLKNSWNYSTIYVNPPYGRNKETNTSIKDWIRACCRSYIYWNSKVLALIPVATNTKHWKEYIWHKATSICFLYDTRLKFMINGNTDNKGAPMACVMIYWGKDNKKFDSIFSEFGAVVKL